MACLSRILLQEAVPAMVITVMLVLAMFLTAMVLTTTVVMLQRPSIRHCVGEHLEPV